MTNFDILKKEEWEKILELVPYEKESVELAVAEKSEFEKDPDIKKEKN